MKENDKHQDNSVHKHVREYIYRAEEIHEIDKRAEQEGFSPFALMENAGRNVAEKIIPHLAVSDQIAILSGRGNNGGDGIVIARYLKQAGYSVALMFPLGLPKTGIARRHKLYYEAQGFYIIEWTEEKQYTVIIDALLGIGTKLPLPEQLVQIVNWANQQNALRIAIDLPTGVQANVGKVEKTTVFNAHKTLSLHGFKPSAFLLPASTYYGETSTVPIGLRHTSAAAVITEEDVVETLPNRERASHKGTFGTSLLLAGSDEMPGSALLSALGAIKTGTGKLIVGTTAHAASIIASVVPEAIFLLDGLQRVSNGETIAKLATVGIGPGLEDEKVVRQALDELWSLDVPIVVDAGALIGGFNWQRNAPVILTPHPREFSRLTEYSVEFIQANRMEVAASYAKQHHVIVVLKGHFTVIAFPNGKTFINRTGNNALAKGGTGDVLTGIITSLLATHQSVEHAVLNAVYIHGLCAEYWSKTRSNHSLVASDFATLLPTVLHKLEQRRVVQ